MVETDEYLRELFNQAAEEEKYIDLLRGTQDVQPSGASTAIASPPLVSLMITNQQRAKLRKLGFSEEAIRMMTPAEAHAQLGLSKAGL